MCFAMQIVQSLGSVKPKNVAFSEESHQTGSKSRSVSMVGGSGSANNAKALRGSWKKLDSSWVILF